MLVADAAILGAVGVDHVTIVADHALHGRTNMTTGANEDDHHLRGGDVDRDIAQQLASHEVGTLLTTIDGIGPTTAARIIAELGDKWKFLGLVPFEELAPLYSIFDVQTLLSTNRTESFGSVQTEAMSCGTPLVTSDLPGMRQPVLQSGMGKLFPVNDSDKLADAILDVLQNPKDYSGDQDQIRQRYSPEKIASEYIELFEKLLNNEK